MLCFEDMFYSYFLTKRENIWTLAEYDDFVDLQFFDEIYEMIYIKNSSVECDSGSQVLVGRSSKDISITRSPRKVGSVICNPFGL